MGEGGGGGVGGETKRFVQIFLKKRQNGKRSWDLTGLFLRLRSHAPRLHHGECLHARARAHTGGQMCVQMLEHRERSRWH